LNWIIYRRLKKKRRKKVSSRNIKSNENFDVLNNIEYTIKVVDIISKKWCFASIFSTFDLMQQIIGNMVK
jgi:hypothetical protein